MALASLHKQLISRPPVWEAFAPRWDHVALSSRVRLARNLAARVFPTKASAAELETIADDVVSSVLRVPLFRGGLSHRLESLQPAERDLLVERRLISPDLGRGGAGRAFVVDGSHHLAAFVNEEDHVRLQAIVPGLALARAWTLAASVEQSLSAAMTFAFEEHLGYLTACPSNLGTGLRASVMLHLPGLTLCGRIGSLSKALQALGCTLRGALGEGTEAIADLYQVSNQSTLGESEEQILERLGSLISEIVRHEKADRLRLVRKERARLYDHIGRAYGILRNSHLLTAQEALNGISALVTGVRFGIMQSVSADLLDHLFLSTQPGHLQGSEGRELDSLERDLIRARIVRNALRRAVV